MHMNSPESRRHDPCWKTSRGLSPRITPTSRMSPTAAQRVAFGTSGHRGSSLKNSFNEAHILAISQAICEYRKAQGTDGPLFLGMDTHALSEPAFASAIEVFAANKVEVFIQEGLAIRRPR